MTKRQLPIGSRTFRELRKEDCRADYSALPPPWYDSRVVLGMTPVAIALVLMRIVRGAGSMFKAVRTIRTIVGKRNLEILKADQQVGEWFSYAGGLSQVILSEAQPGSTYRIEVRRSGGPAAPMIDAYGIPAQLAGAGAVNIFIAAGVEYRVAGDSPAAVGAVATIAHVCR